MYNIQKITQYFVMEESDKQEYYTCETTGKRCYSQKEAGTIANKYSKKHQKNYIRNVPTRYYYCNDCRQYHLTHKSLKEYIS